jgi:hypothetical protein
VTVALYAGLFYFGLVKRGGVYDDLRAKLAVTMLNGTVREIEFYKSQTGHYPKRLSELDAKDPMKMMNITDPTFVERKGESDARFYYELDSSGRFYFLRSVGPDGIPFTPDDILPTLTESEMANIGLRLKK